jgi:tripeptidyl-peptidase-1
LRSSGAFHYDNPTIQFTDTPSQTAAGVISLLNDFLISQGNPPLGFLNPWIYSTASTGFNDITSGSNAGCGTSGFSAAQGWDPVSAACDVSLPCGSTYDSHLEVTGLGTADFLKLQNLVPM